MITESSAGSRVRLTQNPVFVRLFTGQVIALLGTGVLTVALGLLAFDIAGAQSGVVLGTALTIKVLAYVTISPIATAVASRLPRRAVLVGSNVVRGLIALGLPWVTETWQIYVLIFLLQSATAVYTPTFQAVIPDIVAEDEAYTRALSYSRLATDLEAIASPILAAALLTLISFHMLFMVTVVGFLAAAVLAATAPLPATGETARAGKLWERTTRGMRLFFADHRLRALLALDMVVAAPSAFVLTNSVVLVRERLGRDEGDLAVALAVYGLGSMLMAFLVPQVLRRATIGAVMLAGGLVGAAGAAFAWGVVRFASDAQLWPWLLAAWFVIGAGNSAILTPSARLIRDRTTRESRPYVLTAQFSLSHACFIITYPIAGWLGGAVGLSAAAGVLAVVAALAVAVAWSQWGQHRPEPVGAGSGPGGETERPDSVCC